MKMQLFHGTSEKNAKEIEKHGFEPDKIKIIGVTYFNGKNLIHRCDPVISPINFRIMGEYYKQLSEWIFQGKEIINFPNFMGLN